MGAHDRGGGLERKAADLVAGQYNFRLPSSGGIIMAEKVNPGKRAGRQGRSIDGMILERVRTCEKVLSKLIGARDFIGRNTTLAGIRLREKGLDMTWMSASALYLI